MTPRALMCCRALPGKQFAHSLYTVNLQIYQSSTVEISTRLCYNDHRVAFPSGKNEE